MLRFKHWLVFVALLCASVAAQAPLDIRVALVIGNAAYRGEMALLNPTNDARAMADTLKGLGFSVMLVNDGKQTQITQAIAQLQAVLKGKQGVGMLYYAGHGVQYDWRNFMVPIDARLASESDIPVQTIDVSTVLDAFKIAGNRLNLVVLDACRDNPFDNNLATKGLAPVDAPPGTFIAFATAPGNVADDGDEKSPNGLYTKYLLQELRNPSSRLEDVFKRVKLSVRQESAGRQVPSDSSNLDEEFSFAKGFVKAEPEKESVRQERYNTERAEWNRIRGSQNANDFFRFLQRYPNGFISEIAQFRADQLAKPTLIAQALPQAVVALASGSNRYALNDEYTLVTTNLMTNSVRTERLRVTSATNDRVEINGGTIVFDQMGGLIEDDSGVKDPPIVLVPADIALGKRWRSVFTNTIMGFNASVYVDFKTVAFEDLETPDAKLKVFKVDMDGWAIVNGASGNFFGTLWIEPRTMRLVRYDRNLRGGGKWIDHSSQVMTNYKPAPR